MNPLLIPPDGEEPHYPLSVRDDPELQAAYATPAEGLPAWLEPSIWSWVLPKLRQSTSRNRSQVRIGLLQEFERVARSELSRLVESHEPFTSLDRIRAHLKERPETYLDLVDFLAGKELVPPDGLERYLREGGSVWTVDASDKPYVLLRRVSPEMMASRDRVLAEVSETPGHLLTLAWRATYGRNPHPSDGYRSAVRACEATLVPAVLAGDPKATLGRAIAHLDQARPRWSVELPGDAAKVDSQETFLGMLRHLWTGQYDRHVTENVPLHVSQREAEQALLLAVAVLQLATTAAFRHE